MCCVNPDETTINLRASSFKPMATNTGKYESDDVELAYYTLRALDYLEGNISKQI